jgi:hypothetical protein
MPAAAPLGSHLHHPLVLARRRQHRPPLAHARGQRLLDIHVLARLTRHHRRQRVPVIRRRDNDGVDILPIQRRAKVAGGVRPVAPLLLNQLHRLRHHRVVHIAEHGAFDLGVQEESREIPAPHPAAANQAHAHLGICGHGLAGRAGNHKAAVQSSRRQRGSREELAAVHGMGSGWGRVHGDRPPSQIARAPASSLS